jgi:hypothetical protein
MMVLEESSSKIASMSSYPYNKGEIGGSGMALFARYYAILPF